MLSIATLAFLGFQLAAAEVSQLKHPGIYYTEDHIKEYRSNALSGKEPWASAYRDLLTNYADPNYTMRGPAPIIGRGTGDSAIQSASLAFDGDGKAVEALGVAYSINQGSAYAKKVVEIVDGWSGTLKEIANRDNILVSWAGTQMAVAAELVYYVNGGWPSGAANYKRAQDMVSKILQPASYAFARPENGMPAAGGNQAILGHAASLAFNVFTNNVTGFNEELKILALPKKCDNFSGSGIRALIHPTTGQNAESGRDQTHSGIEVAYSEEAAWIASVQGDHSLFNLKGDSGAPLVVKGLEYWTKYNLGETVPYDSDWYPCCCSGAYGQISDINRGRTDQPMGEAAYRYFVEERGWSMPYTKRWLQKIRPEGNNYMPFPTLTFAKGTV